MNDPGSREAGGLLLRADGVGKSYEMGRTTVDVLKGVMLDIHQGESLAIIGASGAGKSTLLHLLGGLDRPNEGNILYRDQDLYMMTGRQRNEFRATKVGFVFQSFYLLPEMDVVDNVMLPAMGRRGAMRKSRNLHARAMELLDRVQLSHRADHRPLELSGGEQQRVAIARALMNGPELILADEPTGNLDSKTGEQVLSCLFDLASDKEHTLVVVTHNESVAGQCSRRLLLRDGCMEELTV